MSLKTPAQLRAHLDQLQADRKNALERGTMEGAKALDALQRLAAAGANPNPDLEKIAEDAVTASENWRKAEANLAESMAGIYKRLEDLAGPARP